MSPYNSRSLLDRLIGACFGLLLGAAALYLAARLIESVAWILLTIIGVLAGSGLLVAWLRSRNRGW
jgi:thiol:disulfide interchange protein